MQPPRSMSHLIVEVVGWFSTCKDFAIPVECGFVFRTKAASHITARTIVRSITTITNLEESL